MTSWAEVHGRRQQQPDRDPFKPTPTGIFSNGGGYATAALRREVENVSAALEGSRNHTLNVAAFNLGQLVAAGELTDSEVVIELEAAGRACGLDDSEITATINSGMNAGEQRPRTIPEQHPLSIPTLSVAAVVAGPDVELAPARTSWWPVVITEAKAGQAAAPQPTILHREDGAALLYPGKVNGLIGESESGKSWLGLLAVAQVIRSGLRVLMLDFEDSAAAIYDRLATLGVDADALELLDYAAPDEALNELQRRDLTEARETGGYALVLVDGVNAAMTLLGLDLNSNTDATYFAQRLLRPLAATGAAVLTIDHLPKAAEARGKGGIGAQAKRAMMDGCCLSVSVVEPFGRGQNGVLKLWIDKDRPGAVRGAAAGSTFAGRALLTSAGDQLDIRIVGPDGSSVPIEATFRPTAVMEKVSRVLARAKVPLATKDVVERSHSRKAYVLTALQLLEAEGFSEAVAGPGQGKLHRQLKAYNQVEDPASDLYEPASPAVVPGGSAGSDGTGFAGGSRSVPPYGGREPASGSEDLTSQLDGSGNQSSCNDCGELTEDRVLDETAGYCRACAGRRGA